ncbi:hypothetical protein BYT27DRAFT_7248276 [Phlegmacium glaucopus]|nr:hypothetical protein BYT27DRAFT_7248276 [Phlegmacium glaucopus]
MWMTDDHGSDSNHTKLLGSKALTTKATTLVKWHWQAVETMHEAKEYYTLLSDPVEKGDIDEWETEIKQAETDRLHNPAAMDVMASWQVSSDQNCLAESPDNQDIAGEEWIWVWRRDKLQDCIRKEPQEPAKFPETFADLDDENVSVPTTNPHNNVSINLPSPAAEAIKHQANQYIKALQEVIADKSFQFSQMHQENQ